MRILITACCDFTDAEVTAGCLLKKGHDVLLEGRESGSAVFRDFHPDVVVCYGLVKAAYHDFPVVQVISRADVAFFHRRTDLFVFSGESAVPGGFQDRAVVIPLPVDTEMFCPAAQSRGKIIFAMGRLDPVKGHKTLVQAMTLVNPGFRAVIAGREDLYTVKKMRDYAESLGVENRAEFAGEVEDVIPFLRRAAVGVVASLGNQEASRTGMEIMASGVPLLAAATGGLCDLVTDGVTGLLHSPGNWRQLAGQINHLLENRGLAAILAENAREYCEKHLSYDSVGERWTEVLEQLGFG
ncbi:MAG: glycosyltransferase family 4 protein [Candidatus Sabulitectum sp.]|nr:glycosyltransferase family 4 protein [Candidatus Sabulitectum sp.]